jgi:hypothetical protein
MARFDVRVDCKQPRCQAARLFPMPGPHEPLHYERQKLEKVVIRVSDGRLEFYNPLLLENNGF